MLQSIADEAWIMREELAPAITAMIAHDLSFDALVQPRHLPTLHRFAARWPELPIVIDHGAKPQVAVRTIRSMANEIEALAQVSTMSGANFPACAPSRRPASRPRRWRPMSRIWSRRSAHELMWGSDWPVLRAAGDDYRRLVQRGAIAGWARCHRRIDAVRRRRPPDFTDLTFHRGEETSAMTHRFCLACDLDDEAAAIAAYEEWHQVGRTPAAVIASIRDAGIADMEIFRLGNRLVMVIDADDDFSFDRKAAMDADNPAVIDWEARMLAFQRPLPRRREAKNGFRWPGSFGLPTMSAHHRPHHDR